MVETLETACLAAGLDQLILQELHPEPGEGRTPASVVLLVTPPGLNEPRVITDLVHQIGEAAAKPMAAEPPAAEPPAVEPLRLVIAFDQGITHLTEAGFTGRVVTIVRRLATECRVHAALPDGPGHCVSVVISASLLDDLAPLPPTLDTPDDPTRYGFEPLSVDVPGRQVAAWSYPPGRRFRFPGRS